MHPLSLHAMRCFTRVYLHAQIAVDASDIRTLINHLYFDLREKPEDPQFEPHVGINMAQVLVSPLFTIIIKHISTATALFTELCGVIKQN